MKILITGITGFLGTHLMNFLKKEHEIIGVSGNSEKYNTSSSSIKVYHPDEVHKINNEIDVFVLCHAAVSSGAVNTNRDLLFNANVKFTERITSLFPNAYHLYISSVSVFGYDEKLINEFTSSNPESEYAVSKLWGEKVTVNLPSSGVLRMSSLYGNGMKDHTIIPTYVSQALINGKIEVYGQGERLQNYLHINDAVLYIEAMISKKQRGVYLATSVTETSNCQLAEKIAHVTGAIIEYKGIDNSPSRQFNNEYSRSTLNIKGELDLSEGLKEYILWSKKQF